ncbi:MAG TPA: tetratricopeptide repeat protein [Vicinamibacterales bacterium]|nr:tetratricopeptide repeat protein [Vicinamibacterales bacterium]
MQKESLIFGVAGIFFGVLVGWIVGSQQAAPPRGAAAPAAAQSSASGQQQSAPVLDQSRVDALRSTAERNPNDAETRVQLGDLYFDAEKFEDAIHWYEEALKIDPRNVNASTDLGISFYYLNQPDRALAQFDRSLAIDPKHSKTLLNIGIVRAFGKQDLDGAAQAWQRVVEVAPADSPEAKAARQALEGVRNAHPNLSGSGSAPKTPGS